MSKTSDLEKLARAGIQARGLSRTLAAAYVNVSLPTFNALVGQGLIPRPRALLSRRVWDRLEIDAYFSRLPYDDGTLASASSEGDIWDQASV